MTEYSEPIKQKARKIAIEEAIKALTKRRKYSTLAGRSYVRNVRDHFLISKNTYDVFQANLLDDKSIGKWEFFYDSIIQNKKPQHLKVAYLSGPNPENDLNIFCAAGILPENIWAFESEKSTYLKAVESALNSNFPFIKIIHGGIDAFFEASPQRFDIIYLDFCGPLPSRNKKQKTLKTISNILAHHSLFSLGILITNVALPTEEQDKVGRNLIANLVSWYLYPKAFLENKKGPGNLDDGAITYGIEHDKWLAMVQKDLDEYYSQFITRLIMDHASFISPYDRFPKHSSLFKRFFDIKDQKTFDKNVQKRFHFDKKYNGGDIISDATMNPTLWTLAALDANLNAKDENYPQNINLDDDFRKFSNLFLSQLSHNNNAKHLIENLSSMSYLLSQGNGQEEFLASSLKLIGSKHKINSYYQFCDLFLFHQIIELLFRQIAVPYHTNVEKSKRWKYKSKDTTMFMDMTILDECRYLYDWMPTTDMFASGMSNSQRQLAYRFALDGVSKHRRWYNPEYFFGTAVVSQEKKGFEAKVLKRRKLINKPDHGVTLKKK